MSGHRGADVGRSGWHDPWAWASALAIVPLLLRTLGAPFGVPVADDWDFIHRSLLTGRHSLLDGGGSTAFWRPIPHQIYYGLFAAPMLSRPWVVTVLHAVVLAATAVLAYRAARTRLPGSAAAAVASFPLLTETARFLVTWPSPMVELSFLFFSVLALHEASFRRLASAALALLAALLCKEVALVTAAMLPWVPRLGGASHRRERLKWIVMSGAVALAWGIAYVAVRRTHHLHLPHDLERGGGLEIPWPFRYGWALANSFRAAWSLPVSRSPWEWIVWVGLTAIAIAVVVFARSREARARLRGAVPTMAFGVGWMVAAAAPLTFIHPFWMPHRALFGSLGLALALVALLGAVRPALIAVLVALRLAMLALSPAVPTTITPLPPRTGAFLDFEKVTRLQLLMVETRALLHRIAPTLPSGARVGLLHPPHLAAYAFGGDQALQSWYRDTTLRLLRYTDFQQRPELELAAIVHYQDDSRPQMLPVNPRSMRHYLTARQRSQAEDWQSAMQELALADSTQPERRARGYLAQIAGRRALCWIGMGRMGEGEREARRALALWREESDARYTLASVMALSGRGAQARAHLDTLLALHPEDASARALRDSIASWSAAER